MDYRTFLNTDPPALAHLWGLQSAHPRFARHVTATQFEQQILSKLYFDRRGLVVAQEGDEIVGFAHAAFGPNAAGNGLDTQTGATAMLLVRPQADAHEIAKELLRRSEAYLIERGAQRLEGGGSSDIDGFYLGFYGGSRLPGVLASHDAWLKLFREAGYEEHPGGRLWQRSLGDFRPPIDRHTMQWRRQYRLDIVEDPPGTTWWQENVWSAMRRAHYSLRHLQTQEERAGALVWEVDPLAMNWGPSVRGLYSLHCPSQGEEGNLPLFFLAEVLKSLASQGVGIFELTEAPGDERLGAVAQQLGFKLADSGVRFSRELSRASPAL